MKTKEKEMLVKSRPALVRSLDPASVLPRLRADNSFTKKEEDSIMSDPRRRERVVKFLDLMEKKKTDTYNKFLDILECHFPHIFLQMTDQWDGEEDSIHMMNSDLPLASHATLDDDWANLHHARSFLIREIDAANIVGYLRTHDVIDNDEMALVKQEKNPFRRTEALLDILEMKPRAHYDIFVDSVGEVYPHVFLALTGDGGVLTDDDDDYDF